MVRELRLGEGLRADRIEGAVNRGVSQGPVNEVHEVRESDPAQALAAPADRATEPELECGEHFAESALVAREYTDGSASAHCRSAKMTG